MLHLLMVAHSLGARPLKETIPLIYIVNCVQKKKLELSVSITLRNKTYGIGGQMVAQGLICRESVYDLTE